MHALMKIQQVLYAGWSYSFPLNLRRQCSHASLSGTGFGKLGTFEKSKIAYLCAKMDSIVVESLNQWSHLWILQTQSFQVKVEQSKCVQLHFTI
jgi:hypothetical protein